MCSSGAPEARCLDPEGVVVIDNHLGVPDSAVDYLKPPKEFPLSQIKFSLTRLSLVWQVMLMMMMVMIIIMIMTMMTVTVMVNSFRCVTALVPR